MSDSIGVALRELGGKASIEVVTRVRDFNIQTMKDPQSGKEAVVPVDTLVAFKATAFRELGKGSDVWEFRTQQATDAGPVSALMYLRGEDLFMVRTLSQVQA